MPGLYEDAARTRKALRIADALAKLGGAAEQAATLPDAGWLMAAQLAGCNPPSPATRAVVVSIMADREERRRQLASNRYHGVPGRAAADRRAEQAAADALDCRPAADPFAAFGGQP